MNMAQLMSILSKMDKKDLEQGLNKMNQMLKNNDVNSIINQIKKDKQFSFCGVTNVIISITTYQKLKL